MSFGINYTSIVPFFKLLIINHLEKNSFLTCSYFEFIILKMGIQEYFLI